MSLAAFLAGIPRSRWFSIPLTGLLVVLGMAALYITQPGIIQRTDLRVYDAFLPLRVLPAPSAVPVIIDIDEASLDSFGQWPWPRSLLAELVYSLQEQGVASVGLDIMFAEEDRTSPDRIVERLKQERNVSVEFTGLPENLRDHDRMLASALQEVPAVLAAYARHDKNASLTASLSLPSPPGLVTRSAPGALPVTSGMQSATNAILPLEILRQNTPVGFINVAPDPDGLIRRVPLVVLLDGHLYPSLALGSLMRAMGKDSLVAFAGADGLEGLRIGKLAISLAPDGTILVPFQGGRHTYEYISAADALNGTLPPGSLAGRIAFIGTSSPGLADIRSIPPDHAYPGVELHAAVIDSLLNNNSLILPAWAPGMQLIGIFVAGLIATLAFGFSRPAIYLPAAAIIIGATLGYSRHCFLQGLYFSPLYAILTTVAAAACLLVLRFYQEEKQKLMLRSTFSRYVSPEVVKKITRHKGDLFAGEERELSILFTDIRSFTTISEKLGPEQIVLLLNRYFTPMTAIVRERSGTLDKFIGDALMAFWNAPLAVEGHPALAVDAALTMQERLQDLNGALHEEFGLNLRIGAGIHTGNAYVGNMGSADLVNYTLIGDNVNLASRLEGLCPFYGVPVVVSGETRAHCQGTNGMAFQFLDTIRVKGKDQPVDIFAPMREEAWIARHDEITGWNAARTLYQQGNFAEASTAFELLQQAYPDSILYKVYNTRSKTLCTQPPESWNGIWTMTAK